MPNDPQAPRGPHPPQMSMSLVVKLASLVIHAEEVFSVKGHTFDRDAILTLTSDPEVQAWVASLDRALLPVKR